MDTLPTPQGSLSLMQWMRRTNHTQESVAALMGDPCTQALVSKWARRLVTPSQAYAERLIAISGGQISMRRLQRIARK